MIHTSDFSNSFYKDISNIIGVLRGLSGGSLRLLEYILENYGHSAGKTLSLLYNKEKIGFRIGLTPQGVVNSIYKLRKAGILEKIPRSSFHILNKEYTFTKEDIYGHKKSFLLIIHNVEH